MNSAIELHKHRTTFLKENGWEPVTESFCVRLHYPGTKEKVEFGFRSIDEAYSFVLGHSIGVKGG
jgi:hypothetical protein